MKTQNDKNKFIELRAQGLSFEKISREINVSKSILIKWNLEFHKEIVNLRFFEVDALVQQYKMTKNAKVRAFLIQLEKALEELSTRSLEEVSVKELVAMILQLDGKIKSEVSDIHCFSGCYQEDFSSLIRVDLKEKIIPFVY